MKLNPENLQYWLNRGYSREDSEKEALKRKGYRCKWNRNYYIFRGKSEEEADLLVEEAKKIILPIDQIDWLDLMAMKLHMLRG